MPTPSSSPARPQRRPQPQPQPSRSRRPAPAPEPPGTARRRRRPKWAMRAVTTLSVVVLASAGIGHALVTSVDKGVIERVDPFKDMKNRPAPGHGMNLLLVGTDERDKLSWEDKAKYRLGGAPCHCTDTIMIVHISQDRKRASVVSLPRDSYAEMPAHFDETTGMKHHSHPVKINAAYAEGGPQLTVRTVEHMTHLKIDHYLEVDFTSFMKTVDALGGVQICTTKPLRDSHTGLDLSPGTHTLEGGEALQYVRSRYIDAASDLSRMQRQQRFLAAVIAKATSTDVLLNPVKFRDVSEAVLGSVRADKGFGANEMLALGHAMRSFSPKSSEFTTVPINGYEQLKGIGSTLKWDTAKSEKIFEALREDKPLTAPRAKPRATVVDVAPQQIRVQVENGTGLAGLGRRVDSALRSAGFLTTKEPVNAKHRTVKRTIVTYDPRWDRSARSLATALPGSELRPVKGQGSLLKVIAGTDFKQVKPVRVEEEEVQPDKISTVTGDQVVCP
ncbi:LCP family protein [Streptomyces sp. NPDC002896]|uniref:LCP family protein n=1 Tax=Streptomyces sp. NPDC002896 TaxID=3154438 RepID=UPI003331A1F8